MLAIQEDQRQRKIGRQPRPNSSNLLRFCGMARNFRINGSRFDFQISPVPARIPRFFSAECLANFGKHSLFWENIAF